MRNKRWRDVKQNRINDNSVKKEKDIILNYAPLLQRLKAQITDTFLLYMPLLYLITYFILDGKEEFQDSSIAQSMAIIIYGTIYAIFLKFSGQTPGRKAYLVQVVDSTTGKTIGFFRALLRFIVFLFSTVTIFGIVIAYYREDKKTLQDLITNTAVVTIKD